MKRLGSAVILAGGKSRRMGFDKCSIKIGERLLIDIIAEKLSCIFDEIILVTNDSNKFEELQYRVVRDIKENIGPAGGIYTGLKAAASEFAFFTACDMPVVNMEYIKYMQGLIDEFNPDGIVSKKGEWIEPLYAFYSKSMIGGFEKGIMDNSLKLFEIIKNSGIIYVEEEIVRRYSNDLSIFTNLNYQEDLSLLEEIFGRGAERHE